MTAIESSQLLSCLSPQARSSLLRHANAVDLPLRTVLYEENSAPRFGFFLLSGLASVVVPMADGASAEVGFVGREGLVGAEHLLGPTPLSTRCEMQLSGAGLRVPLSDIQKAFDELQEVRSIILEFAQQRTAALAQIAACNRLHEAEQRLARWLLMAQDQTGYQELHFTHEFLSQMISTQRSTVTVVAGDLQRRGLIECGRGKIAISHRVGLEAAACACYPVLKRLREGLYRHAERGSQDGVNTRAAAQRQPSITA